jgi:hypothetical protein
MNGSVSNVVGRTLIAFASIVLGAGPLWLVKGFVPLYGFTVLYGPPKTGKSFWLFDLLMHCVLGRLYRGRSVHQGPVVYVVAEGVEGFRARVEAFRKKKMDQSNDHVPFYILPAPIDLVAEQDEFIELIRKTLGATLPVAIAFDTLNRTMHGPENSDQAMREYIGAIDAVRSAFNCAAIVVHHSGVEGGRPRGHSSLTGAADAQLAVTKSRAGLIIVKVDAMKDGPEGAVICSTLEPVVVGKDADGEDISSCIVCEAYVTENDIGQGASKLSPQERKALSILKALIKDEGVSSDDDDLSEDIVGVDRKKWRAACLAKGLAESGDEEAFKKAWQRVRKALVKENLVCITDDEFVYLVE